MATSFQQAFAALLRRAPSPLFPRARQLYLRKYCLEGQGDGPFRTFLLEEEVNESEDGSRLTVKACRFALVHWQGPPLESSAYLAYLLERWQLVPEELRPVGDAPWFRQGGAWAWFRARAEYRRDSTLDPEPQGGN